MLWPVLFLTFPVLVWLVDGAAAGRLGGVPSAAIAGWWFGFGYFLAGLYWVGYAFLVDAKTFGWLLPFAVIGAAGVPRAATPRFGLALARALWTRGPTRLLALAVALTVAEWLRGHLFTGFPWNAYRLRADRPAGAGAERGADRHLGAHVPRGRGVREPGGARRRARRHARGPGCRCRSASCVLAALAGYGAVRLARTPTQFVDGVRLRIMQPNLQQDEKFNYAAKADGDAALSRAVRPLDRPAIDRRARRHASDLAGIGVSVPADARARRAGADRGRCCRPAPC